MPPCWFGRTIDAIGFGKEWGIAVGAWTGSRIDSWIGDGNGDGKSHIVSRCDVCSGVGVPDGVVPADSVGASDGALHRVCNGDGHIVDDGHRLDNGLPGERRVDAFGFGSRSRDFSVGVGGLGGGVIGRKRPSLPPLPPK